MALVILALGIMTLGIMSYHPFLGIFYHFKNTSVLRLWYFQYQGFRKNTFRIPSELQLSSVHYE